MSENGGRNLAPQQHAIKRNQYAPRQPTMGLDKFEPNNQIRGNIPTELTWTRVSLNSTGHQQGWRKQNTANP